MDLIIPVNYGSNIPTVNGRDLHAALQIETRYNDWFKRSCEYGFVEGKDYYSFLSNRADGLGGKPRKDHLITLDMAKELCMIQRSEIGKHCREYFLEIERKWNSPEAIVSRALLIANQQLQLARNENAQLIKVNTEQAEKIKTMLPKASYYDYVLSAKGLMPISTIAKDYGKSAFWLNKWLHEHGVQYKQGDVWLLYQKYAGRGYVKSKTFTVSDENGNPIAKLHTCWTQTGRLMIYELLKAHGILPLIEQNSDKS